jgi:metal-sulfur cluster biosynthetic enzyme
MEAKDVQDALRQVLDPELGINVVDLGLVYRVTVEAARVEVVMTMTSAACPLGGQLASTAKSVIQRCAPEGWNVEVRMVLEPAWHPGLMSDAARRQLGWTG